MNPMCRSFSIPITSALISVFLLCALPLLAQDSLYIKEHYTKYEFYIPMRDGVRLFTSIDVPRDTTQKYPIILNRTPYSVWPYGAHAARKRPVPSMLEVREGYIFAYQDVRGKYMSEGEYVDVRPYKPVKMKTTDIDEATDTYDTVEWLLKNIPNNNGRVGITGISYPGFYSTMGSIDAHPAVIATSPQAPVADWFIGDDFHHNGAFFLAHAFNFMMWHGKPRPAPTTEWPASFKHGTPDGYKFFLEMGPLPNANKKYMRDSVAFWNEMMQHGTYDEFWQARNVLPHLKNIKPAVMTVGGWFDAEDLYGALKTYEHIEKHNPHTFNILVMGPWHHGQWNRNDGDSLGNIHFGAKTSLWFRENVQHPFFNYYLKGKGEPRLAEAIVFETGANQWHMLDSWPPKNVTEKNLFLQPQGKLGFNAPTKSSQTYSEYVSDPHRPVPFTDKISIGMTITYMVDDQRFAARRPDVLVFESEVLAEEVTVAGPITASLFVATTGTDADWVVKVIDVFPDDTTSTVKTSVPLGGYQMMVRGEPFRGKFRNSYSKPEPFMPNQVSKVEFVLPDVFHRFKKGHKIMLQIQSTWFPLVDRNPQKFVDINNATESDFQKATHRVYHSPPYGSHLKLLIQNK